MERKNKIKKCKLCLRRINESEEFCFHHKQKRVGNPKFKCEKCGKISKSFYSILNCKCETK